MLKEAMSEASKYATAVRNVQKWFEKRLLSITIDKDTKIHELRQALSPAAARIVVAAEGDLCGGTGVISPDMGPAQDCPDCSADPNPAPAWLNQEPAPLPAGALLEVPERPARRRA